MITDYLKDSEGNLTVISDGKLEQREPGTTVELLELENEIEMLTDELNSKRNRQEELQETQKSTKAILFSGLYLALVAFLKF